MRPSLVSDHIQDRSLGDAEASPHLTLGDCSGSEQCAHLIRERDRKFDMGSSTNVHNVRDQLHVRWVHARPVLAEMVRLKAGRYWADELKPRSTVRGTALPVVTRGTITVLVLSAEPVPTGSDVAAVSDLVQIGCKQLLWIDPPMMVVNEAHGFPLDPAARGHSLHRQGRRLTASALAHAARVQAHIGSLHESLLGARVWRLAPHHSTLVAT